MGVELSSYSTVLSVCSGSGSMAEAAISMGRSCILIELDGNYFNCMIENSSLDYQFHQSARRLKEGFETAMSESSKPGMDYNKYSVILSFIKL